MQKRNVGKKGDLTLNQIVELLIALAIILIILIFIAPKLFEAFFMNPKNEQAKGTLESIVQKLNSLPEGEYSSYVVYVPAGWKIISIDKDHNENQGFVKQNQYTRQNILCICDKSCTICQSIEKPLMMNGQQAFLKIELDEIWFYNDKDYYNISKVNPVSDVSISEEETAFSGAYQLSNTKIDQWLQEKNSPLAGQGQCIIDVSTRTLVPSDLILAVSILESGWGKSGLSQQCNNLFGVKGAGTAGSCSFATTEYTSDGRRVKINADFAKYNNFCESVLWFGKLISTSSYYVEAMNNKDDSIKMTYAIHGCSGPYQGKECIYSTAPDWADQVITLINEIRTAQLTTKEV
jgi:beta-N-acetylglucosaminidase